MNKSWMNTYSVQIAEFMAVANYDKATEDEDTIIFKKANAWGDVFYLSINKTFYCISFFAEYSDQTGKRPSSVSSTELEALNNLLKFILE